MTRIQAVILSGLVLLVLLPYGFALADETILLTTGEWPPFFSEGLPHGGVGNRIVAESFARVGVSVEFRFLPWIRALETARYGPAAGSSGWLRMADREAVFLYSDPIFMSRRVFFHRRDDAFDWRTLDDIRDLRVAVTLGSAVEFPFDEIMAKGTGKVDLAKSYESGMRKLAAGRVDLYACNLDVGLYVLAHQISSEEAALVTFHTRPIFEETNHLILSRRLPGAQALMDRFNEGLRRLKESGRYAAIINDPKGRVPLSGIEKSFSVH